MKPGVYQAVKKNGSIYYRSSITYKNKHISLGSFTSEKDANTAYKEAGDILFKNIAIEKLATHHFEQLPFDKAISLINFRDNKIYIGTPIYLCKKYFSYYLSATEVLTFDIDDLFYYSSHRILRRQGHLYVNDYGMQVSILSRYGIKSHAVVNRDYYFVNDNPYDLRYSNIVVVNRYFGVMKFQTPKGITRYRAKIHINGNYTVGTYTTEEKAAIAYNKAADLAKAYGIAKNFPENYVEDLSPKDYADIYVKLKISSKYMEYLKTIGL